MASTITISGTNYSLPAQSDSPAWGENLSSIITALASVASNQAGTGDITLTSFVPANNQSSVANVTGLSFDSSLIRGAIIEYSIYRYTASSELSEVGNLYVSYKNSAGSAELAQTHVGSSGITFSITSGLQIQYTSTNMAGAGYTSKMQFRAKAFVQ